MVVVVKVTFFPPCEECGRKFSKLVVVVAMVAVKVTFSLHVKNVGKASTNQWW